MATGFFVLLDDIAALMDDVATMGKIATKKTAGILGDDLAVNAEKASGFVSQREIPVLLAISKGSLLNKAIILPLAFLLSAYLPWVVSAVLLLGAIYLAYEGAEKIYEVFVPHTVVAETKRASKISEEEILEHEKKKVKQAIVTDFILSIEIVIIALGTVLNEPIQTQIIVVSAVAVIATIGVYGIVALIVRMDDLGYKLIQVSDSPKSFTSYTGRLLVSALPKVIKGLAVVGTIALLLVSGGIFVHNIEVVHHLLQSFPSILGDLIAGLCFGSIALLAMKGFQFLKMKLKK